MYIVFNRYCLSFILHKYIYSKVKFLDKNLKPHTLSKPLFELVSIKSENILFVRNELRFYHPALNLTLYFYQCWNLDNSNHHWVKLLRSRALRICGHIKHHIFSSIWNGINNGFYETLHNDFYQLNSSFKNVTISMEYTDNKIILYLDVNGHITLKIAYSLKSHNF